MSRILSRLRTELENGRPLCLVTILETVGSTPQGSGVSALFGPSGLLAGTLGGGPMEAAAQRTALRSMTDKSFRVERFDLAGKSSTSESAICGGTATVLFDSRPEDWVSVLGRVRKSLEKRESGVLATFIHGLDGSKVEIARRWIPGSDIQAERPAVREDDLLREALEALSSRESRLLHPAPRKTGGRTNWIYVEPVLPLPRLVIAGAGHLGKAVAHLGSLLDFDVTVIDDRPEFANQTNIPDADRFVIGEIGASVRSCPCGSDSYFVIVTRGHTQDTEALRGCIGRGAAYIGVIGSRRKVELTRKNFIAQGWAKAEDLDAVRAPIGIDIGSKSVQEIAVSIAAQLVLVRAGPPGGMEGEA